MRECDSDVREWTRGGGVDTLGRGVHVVTVNDYLARRDAEWMGRVHRSLGLTVGIIQTDMEAEVGGKGGEEGKGGKGLLYSTVTSECSTPPVS